MSDYHGTYSDVPERVSDAPIPAEEYVAEEDQVCYLMDELRAEWEQMEVGVDTCYTFEGQLGLEILQARKRIARLEAEKQDAYAEGWNDAIERMKQLEIPCPDSLTTPQEFAWDQAVGAHYCAISALSKPTAARQAAQPRGGEVDKEKP